MGGNAVVLKTRQLNPNNGGGKYEVTACLDNPTAEQAGRTLSDRKTTVAAAVAAEKTPVPASASAPETVAHEIVDTSIIEERLHSLEEKLESLLQMERLAGSGLEAELKLLEETHSALRRADVPGEQITRLLANLKDRSSDQKLNETLIQSRVNEMVAEVIDPDLEFKAGDRVLFIGPAGAGKTSSIGKLTAHLVMNAKLAVKLVTIDNSNVGAYDEIASYAELLGVEVTNPTFTEDDVDDSGDADKVVLIDTGALPTNATELKTFADQIEKLRPTHRLAVFSTLTRSTDIAAFGRALKPLDPSHLVFTMIDLTDSWGGILAAAEATGLKIALTANAPSGGGSLEKPEALTVISKLLGREVKGE
jgi:flagellar biosynthesis protein FlhF